MSARLPAGWQYSDHGARRASPDCLRRRARSAADRWHPNGRSLAQLNDFAAHPRFAENQLVYFTYYKPKSGSTDVAAATLARGRFDGGAVLTDVRDVFVTDGWTGAPSVSPIAFGRDGKQVNAEDAQNPVKPRKGLAAQR